LFVVLSQTWVLDTVEAILGQDLTGLCLQRNSYINRVFECEVKQTKERFIVKFYRPDRWTKEQILEEHKFVTRLAKQGILVIPPLKLQGSTLFEAEGVYLALYPKKGGRILDEFSKEQYQELGRLLARVHRVGATIPVKHRLIWSPKRVCRQQLASILGSSYLSTEYQAAFQKTADRVIQKIEPLFSENQFQFIHGDLHFSNLIHRPDEGFYLIDFDDCVCGSVIQDIWMLLPDGGEENQKEIDWIAEGYSVFADFPYQELRLIPALKAMRQLHFIAWCVMQEQDSSFKSHFPQWGSPAYWNESIKSLQEFL
jgi:Ser/Thr protein kinase RdoA (MazF antagonist)